MPFSLSAFLTPGNQITPQPIPPPAAPEQTHPDLPPIDRSKRQRRQAGLFFGGLAFALWAAYLTRRSITKRQQPISSGVISIKHLQGVGKGKAGENTSALPQQTSQLGRLADSGDSAQGRTAKEDPAQDAKDKHETAEQKKQREKEEAEAAEAELKNSGPLLAVEALGLATVNVFAWGVMALGGLLWWSDIASVEELRRKIRGGMGVDGTGQSEEEAEEEMEEWIARVLDRREKKERGSLATDGEKRVDWDSVRRDGFGRQR